MFHAAGADSISLFDIKVYKFYSIFTDHFLSYAYPGISFSIPLLYSLYLFSLYFSLFYLIYYFYPF